MEIRVLRYFLMVAREGNITKASQLLHITQPTLSRQLMQLEEQLGVALFVRGKRKMILTEEGMLLKRRAEEIINLSQKTELEIGNQNHELNGEITIGCGITAATQIMGELIHKFKKIYPQTTFCIRNGNSDFITENIDNGILDLGFALEPIDLEKLNFIRFTQEERWGLLMKRDCSLAKKEYILASDLQTLPLINSSRQETQKYFQDWYGSKYEQLHFCATSELTTTAAILVKNNMGYAIVIEGSTDDAIGKDLCFKPFYPSLTTHSLIIWKKYQSFSLTVSKFLDFLGKESKEYNKVNNS